MTEQVTTLAETSAIKRDAFGLCISFTPPVEKSYVPYKFLELGLELDKETGNTKIVVNQEIDLDQEIMAQLPSSGLAGMMAVIRRGQATARDFYDTGEPFKDVSNLPDNINDAYQESLKACATKDAIVQGLGLDKSAKVSELDDLVRKSIQNYLNASIAAKTKASAVTDTAKTGGESDGKK